MTITTSQNRRHESPSRLQALEASADRLEIIAKDIERLQGTAILEIAKRLAEARDLFRYCRDEGGFAGWVEARLRFSRQTAYNLLSVHERFGGEFVKFLDTFPATILYLLAAPSTPEAARKEIIARAEKGEKLKVEAVKGAIRAARPVKKATKPAKKQIQPKKSTSPESSDSGVSQVSTAPEKRTNGLPTGSSSSRIPVSQPDIIPNSPNSIFATGNIERLAHRLIQNDRESARRLWKILCDGTPEEIECLAAVLECGLKAEDHGKINPGDGLDIPESLRRATP